MSHRRGRHDIVVEILKVARNGTKKTNIMYKARLSHSQLEKYLNALRQEGFITEESGIWKTTESGINVIKACRICLSLVEKAL